VRRTAGALHPSARCLRFSRDCLERMSSIRYLYRCHGVRLRIRWSTLRGLLVGSSSGLRSKNIYNPQPPLALSAKKTEVDS
jgi:hypothetical protein